MFSGIVEEAAEVVALAPAGSGYRLTVNSKLDHSKTQIGDSIAIQGVCLTVVSIDNGKIAFDVIDETVRRSTIGEVKSGHRVNLERSLKVGDRISGHFVSGHVDATIELLERKKDGIYDRMLWSIPSELRGLIAEKGSICISGVSLTVGEVTDKTFCVYIIPHTAAITTLGAIAVGGRANVEVDMLARYIRALLRGEKAGEKEPEQSTISESFLKSHGY